MAQYSSRGRVDYLYFRRISRIVVESDRGIHICFTPCNHIHTHICGVHDNKGVGFYDSLKKNESGRL